jgi:uncharacterized membrane protein YccC
MVKFAGFPLSAWAFALRTWAAMMLALYVAFWLQLENGYIAAFTVGILSLQTRGQALAINSVILGAKLMHRRSAA